MVTQRWFLVLAAALLASCADYGAPDEVVFGEAVYTQQSPTGFPLPAGTTYFVDPSARVVDDDNVVPQEEVVPPPVLQAIRDNMNRLGYVEDPNGPPLLPTPTADVGIKLAILRGTGAVYYPGYWCDYWAYPYCYYDYVYAGTYEFGTVVIGMGDLSEPPGGRLPILWTSAIYGVSQGVTLNIPRVVDGVNRAFAQSPYLDTTP